jgi:hypothetical protein
MRDLDVRQALRATELARHVNDPSTLVIDELGLQWGTVRVDIAVVNGSIHGYEIKSDVDTLDRLPGQAEVYSRVLDRVTLVAGIRHLDEASAIVPKWWGLCTASCDGAGVVAFRHVRRGKRNPGLDLEAVAALLWRDEALQILEERGLATGLRSKPRRELYRALVRGLTAFQLRSHVRAALKSRTGWRSDAPRT